MLEGFGVCMQGLIWIGFWLDLPRHRSLLYHQPPQSQRATADSTCPAILLAPSAAYVLTEFIRVPPGRRVAVVGRPLGMPLVDGSKTYRAFTVEPGGLLDLRYIRFYRGKPVRVLDRWVGVCW